MKTKNILCFTVFICCIGCGVIDRPEIPLTEKEITFFDQINHHPLTIDSVTREIEIGRLMWDTFTKDVLINIYSYSTEDSLTIKERDLLSDKIVNFYFTLEIENIKFTSCLVKYLRSEEQNGKDYFYSYSIEKGRIKLTGKSYKLKEEAQQSDSLKYLTD